MASIMTHLHRMDLAAGPGLVGVVVDTGVGFGASYGIGRTYQKWGKTNWAARNVAELSGAIGKGLAVICAVFGAPQLLTAVFNATGQAGVNAKGLEMGLRHERDAQGKRAVLIDKAAALPAGASEAAIGALGRARSGATPSWDAIAEMAST